ncbi:hypothetical protein DFJ74DRAFT_679499 [Hyaloraphidium curvatum]|nr:hypothetical protein DFJ74DRAFT_679499 [Hyaloraphidium curvatum]
MCRSARVVINCVGPFRFYGEVVVRFCAQHGSDHVDITGEPEFVETMYLRYHRAARKSGATISSCCGFDSIPAELGTVFVKRAFAAEGATATQVEMFHRVLYDERFGLTANFATYESAVNGFGFAHELRETRKMIDAEMDLPKLPTIRPKLKLNTGLFHKEKRLDLWTLVFPGADAACVRLSQRQVLQLAKEGSSPKGNSSLRSIPPVQFSAYFGILKLWNLLLLLFYGAVFSLLARYEWGRKALLDYSGLFSHGVFVRNKTPSEEQLRGAASETVLIGRGFKRGSSGNKLDLEIVVKQSGPEPGYVGTPIFIVACAHQLLKEKHGAKPTGLIPPGVLLPAAAFGDTDLIERLQDLGEKFEVVERREL